VWARFEVRVDEIHQSLNLIDQLVSHLPGGRSRSTQEIAPGASGPLVQSPRGRLVHWVRGRRPARSKRGTCVGVAQRPAVAVAGPATSFRLPLISSRSTLLRVRG
jgi:Ni,Fe-hydrogenase III large subunit